MTPDSQEVKVTLIEALVRARWFLLFTGAAATVAVVAFLDVPLPNLPMRAVKVFGTTFVVAGAIASPVARRIVEWLFSPNLQYLVDFNAETDELAVWGFTPTEWADLTVEEDTHRLQASEPVYEVEGYDPDDHHAEGTWRGSATDLELVEHREAVSEIRGDLEDLAQDGLAIRVKQSTIVRGAVQNIVMDFVSDFEENTTYSGEKIQTRVDSALDDLGDDPADTAEPAAAAETTERISAQLADRFDLGSQAPGNVPRANNGNE